MKARLILILFGTFLALLSAEVAARIFTFYIEGRGRSISERLNVSDNQPTQLSANSTNLRGLIRSTKIPDLVFELRPFTSGIFQKKPYQSNSFGARDREYQLEKPKDTLRIVGIGDSVMFGWGVSENESYLSLIEQKFRSAALPQKQIEVINFGTPGYNTSMEVALFEQKALLFQPDIVVLHVVNNDLDVPLFMSKPHNIFSLKESFLARLIAPTTNTEHLVRHSINSSKNILEEYRHLAGIAAFRKSLMKLSKIAKERKIPVFVVSGRLPRDMRRELSKICTLEKLTQVSVKEQIEKIMLEKNIPNTLKARMAAFQVSLEDSHPNALGHQAYAAALTEALVKNEKVLNAVDVSALK